MEYLNFSNSYFQIALYTVLLVILIASASSIIKKDAWPLKVVWRVSLVLCAVLIAVMAFSYFRSYALLIIGFFVGILLVTSVSKTLIQPAYDMRPLPSRGSGFCSIIGAVCLIGGLMYLIFSKYTTVMTTPTATQKEGFSLIHISVFLLTFCAILCTTSWILSIIIMRVVSSSNGISNMVYRGRFANEFNPGKVRDLIVSGKLLEAIETIEQTTEHEFDFELRKACILLKANLNEIETKYNHGILGEGQLSTEKMRLIDKILNLVKTHNLSGKTLRNHYQDDILFPLKTMYGIPIDGGRLEVEAHKARIKLGVTLHTFIETYCGFSYAGFRGMVKRNVAMPKKLEKLAKHIEISKIVKYQ